jgi:16S rRNA (guanine527-N7)-methyltransferase
VTLRTELDVLLERVRGAGVPLDERVAAQLERFVELVRSWSDRMNLISRRELDRIVEKHVAPSLAPLAVVHHVEAPACVVDIGSGGGFPGLVLAIARPGWRVNLIEPVRKKTLFLERAGRELANVEIWRRRAEACHEEVALRGRARLVTSRAVAPPHEVWALARPFLSPQGELHVFVPRGAHDALAEKLRASHEAVEVLSPIEPVWARGTVLRARPVV